MVETLTARQTASWTIEPLPTGQLEALAAFQQRAYADQFNARFFVDHDEVLRRLEWQYLQCQDARPDRLPVWVLRQGDVIAGQLVIRPVEVKLGGRWLRGGWCQDFVVAPEYRRRGAGVALVREILRAIAAEMSVVLVGGTNQDSYPIFLAAGFCDVGRLPRYVGLMPLARVMSQSVHTPRDVAIEACDQVDGRFDQWWRARETSYTALVRRDQAWFRWRFHQHPHWRYQTWVAMRNGHLEGYVVTRIGQSRMRGMTIPTCRIVEIAAGAPVARLLLAQAVRDGAEHHCRLVRCDLLDSVLGPRVFTHRGLWAVPSSNRILANILDPAIGLEVKPLERWFLSAADSDFDLYEPE